MPEAGIIDAVRTPIGVLEGALSAVRPGDLAAVVLEAVLERRTWLISAVWLLSPGTSGKNDGNC